MSIVTSRLLTSLLTPPCCCSPFPAKQGQFLFSPTAPPCTFHFPIPAESEAHCRESSDCVLTLFSCSILVASTALSSLSCYLGQLFPVRKIHCFPFSKFFWLPFAHLGPRKFILKSPFCIMRFNRDSGYPPAVIYIARESWPGSDWKGPHPVSPSRSRSCG